MTTVQDSMSCVDQAIFALFADRPGWSDDPFLASSCQCQLSGQALRKLHQDGERDAHSDIPSGHLQISSTGESISPNLVSQAVPSSTIPPIDPFSSDLELDIVKNFGGEPGTEQKTAHIDAPPHSDITYASAFACSMQQATSFEAPTFELPDWSQCTSIHTGHHELPRWSAVAPQTHLSRANFVQAFPCGMPPHSLATSLRPGGANNLQDPTPSQPPTRPAGAAAVPRAGGGKKKLRAWTAEEQERFVVALAQYRTAETEAVGADGQRSVGLGPGTAELISAAVGTCTVAQVRSHAQKYFLRQRRLGDSSSAR